MLKKFAIFAASVAVCTMVALSYVTARFVDKAEILRVKDEMEQLQQQRTALEAKVAELTQQQLALNQKITTQTQEIAANQSTIVSLKKQRDEQQLTVRMLRTEDAQLQKFLSTYPEVAKTAKVGVTKMVVNEPLNITLDYLVIPLGFAETFIIEHETLENQKKQLQQYQQNEKLYGSVIDLKDQVLSLESEKTQAYRNGYNEAFTLYEDVNSKYVELLQKPPKLEFKTPGTLALLGCSALGIAVGASF